MHRQKILSNEDTPPLSIQKGEVINIVFNNDVDSRLERQNTSQRRGCGPEPLKARGTRQTIKHKETLFPFQTGVELDIAISKHHSFIIISLFHLLFTY